MLYNSKHFNNLNALTKRVEISQLPKAQGALGHKEFLELKHEAQATGAHLIDAKHTFLFLFLFFSY